MAKFKELSNYKNTIIERLIESEDISKAIYYTDLNFLEKKTLDDPSELIYDNIFPYRFIPERDSTKKTYITMSFTKFSSVNGKFKSGYIYLYVFTHIDLFKTVYGCTRIDFILNKIDELFNQKRGIGIGQLEFVEMSECIVNDKYQGHYLCYKPVDFN